MPAGAVVFSSRAPIGYVAIASNPLCTNQGFKSFVPEKRVSPDFLYYYLHRAKPLAVKLASGTTFLEISGKRVATLPVPIPPLAEQQRIAERLDELLSDLDAGIATLERVRKKLKYYRTAVLKAAVEGALTAEWRCQHRATEPAAALLTSILAQRRRRWEAAQLAKFQAAGKSPPKDWRAKYSEPASNDTSHLRVLPEGWCWASLDQLSIFTTSGSRGWAEYYSQEGPLFVRSQDIRTDRLVLADVAHVMPPVSSEGARTRLRRGDLLVTITGANVAKAAVVDCELDEAYVSQHVGMTRLAFSDMGAFVHIYVTAPSGGRKMLLQAAYGAGKPGLNLDNLRELPIPVPPLHEQAAIVDAVEEQLSVIDHIEAGLEARLNSAQALRQSILRHAFTGQLVPQDPNDEPAGELLKRIAAEREERARQIRAAKRPKQKPRTPRRRVAKN